MFPLDLSKCQFTLDHEGTKAVDALSACTAAVIGESRGYIVSDAQEQQRIEEFWKENLPKLMVKSVEVLVKEEGVS